MAKVARETAELAQSQQAVADAARASLADELALCNAREESALGKKGPISARAAMEVEATDGLRSSLLEQARPSCLIGVCMC